MKDKKARRKGRDDGSITSDMLVEIMEESIRIFWRFVRSDKDAQNVISKGRKGTQIEPQDPTELELLTEVRTNFQKVSFVSISIYILLHSSAEHAIMLCDVKSVLYRNAEGEEA
jgi:hypothetical protein